MPGVRHPDNPDLWIFASPANVLRLPRLVIVYTIDAIQGEVTLWNLHRIL